MNVSTKRGTVVASNVPVAPGCPPTRWWRSMAASNFHAMAVEAMKAAVETVEMLGEPSWRDAVAGNAAAAVGTVILFDRQKATPGKLDLVMTALVICACEGTPPPAWCSSTSSGVFRIPARARHALPPLGSCGPSGRLRAVIWDESDMKLQILDDLHIDYPGSRGIPALAHGVDVVIVAGDTCHGLTQAIGSLRSAYPSPTEIVMVAGNHELWSADWPSRSTSRKAMPPPNWPTSTFLENQVVTIDGVRIVGATLWTDYELFGPDLREAAMRAAADHMLDHKRIKWRSDPWARSNPTGYSDENRHFDASFVVELPN